MTAEKLWGKRVKQKTGCSTTVLLHRIISVRVIGVGAIQRLDSSVAAIMLTSFRLGLPCGNNCIINKIKSPTIPTTCFSKQEIVREKAPIYIYNVYSCSLFVVNQRSKAGIDFVISNFARAQTKISDREMGVFLFILGVAELSVQASVSSFFLLKLCSPTPVASSQISATLFQRRCPRRGLPRKLAFLLLSPASPSALYLFSFSGAMPLPPIITGDGCTDSVFAS